MPAYMFQLDLPPMTEEVFEVVPYHREHVAKLFAAGTLLMYSVSQQRHYIWCVVQADAEQEAMEVIAAMPLHPYFSDIACHPLLFYNMLSAQLPDISLN